MTPAQLATFKAAILADGSLSAFRTAGNHGAIAAYYAGAGSGFYWRSSIAVSELNTAIDWTAFIALSTAAQLTYQAMIAAGYVDARSTNIRAGFAAVFPAAGATAATLTALTAIAQQVPTKFEALFVASNISSAPGTWPSVADVAQAMNS